ncbi:hypothetical protein GS634_21275 [Ruegeria atlantica]|uniref:Uncharacterized protein n=1 Tax=Ruegeria atlantica TaxID=81569 RepID=A0AA90ZHP2_9RHOB|nr:hypothetical protein [Ruegeria atlantica]NOE20669.1 hypothetical protein [Ruegeria atlantica]
MIVAVGLTAVVAFVLALVALRLIPTAISAINIASAAVAAMRDPSLNEEARETAVQRASLRLFGCFGQILWRFLTILAISAAPILTANALGLAETEAVTAWLLRWDVIIILSVSLIALWYLKGRVWTLK